MVAATKSCTWHTTAILVLLLIGLAGTQQQPQQQQQPPQQQQAEQQESRPWYEALPAVAMDYKVHIEAGKEDCYFQYVQPGSTFYVSFQVG